MLVIIAGNLGSGKTLYLTKKAVLASINNINIVSNYDLFGIEHETLSLLKFLKSEYNNSYILIDEIYSLLDARKSMSNQNTLASHTLFQSRKKNIHIYGTLPLGSVLDLRFRDLTDYYIVALGLVMVKGKRYYKYRIRYKTNKGFFKYRLGYIPLETAGLLYDYYDTYQTIDIHNKEEILEQFKTQDEHIDSVRKIAQEVILFYDKWDNITHDDIKSYLFNHKMPLGYEPLVYVECKIIKKDDKK